MFIKRIGVDGPFSSTPIQCGVSVEILFFFVRLTFSYLEGVKNDVSHVLFICIKYTKGELIHIKDPFLSMTFLVEVIPSFNDVFIFST